MSALVSSVGAPCQIDDVEVLHVLGANIHGADVLVAETPTVAARLRSFHTLDALRGVAAVAVVLFHGAFFFGVPTPPEGQVAVDLFFVMSGFIIAYRYEGDLARGLGFGRFATLRLVRLYPLFLLGAVLGVLPAIAALAAGHADAVHEGLVESFPLALFMLPSRYALPHIQELYPLNYVAWSLALEIVVNVIYAATFRFWTIRNLLAVIGLGFVGLCVCATLFGSLKYGYAWPQVPVGFVRVVYGFAMGVLIFRLFALKPFAVRVPWWTLLVAAMIMFCLPMPWGRPAWEVLVVAILVPLIVVAAIVNEPPKVLQGACAVAGIASYVVYSLHVPFIGLFLRGEGRLHFDLRVETPVETLVFTVLLVALCVAAHLFYDRPLRRMLSRLSKSRPRAAILAARK